MAIILNEHRSKFIRNGDEKEQKWYFSIRDRRFVESENKQDNTLLVPVPTVSVNSILEEYLLLIGLTIGKREDYSDEFSYFEHLHSIAAKVGLDDEMDQYVGDYVSDLMNDWIKQYSLENMKISLQMYDLSTHELHEIRPGLYGVNREIEYLKDFFYSVQIEKEKLDEELYRLKHQ